ncbi:class I SAM-dependent methyltransferase [Bradyrhizobium sp.]|uniref:class I SAM-dependent methyltransferase n=1 Tax=Bradyrhizobium sp. TaxID=376 RepID=UPI001D40E4BE|nr:class I SAM-dependent methyltransferase [Bradyrhizobium sp.]MBI5323253.1 hypothetical protein [Bradyrhizobium sp.]
MKPGKMDIVNLLGHFHGHASFLEISTATTGGAFARVDASRFTTIHRLAYNVGDDFDDGAAIEFRSRSLDIGTCVAELDRRGARYDVILVDSFHDYECSRRDLDLAFRLIGDEGTIVVHDVLPPATGSVISPTFVPGEWCGLTFVAFVDFLMQERPVFSAVDCDYGCGIVTRRRGSDVLGGWRAEWQKVRGDPEQAFRFLSRHKAALLNLQSARDFVKRHDSPATRTYLREARRIMAASLFRRLWKG